MNKHKQSFPYRIVLFTALITMGLSFGAAFLFGYIPRESGHVHPPGEKPESIVEGDLLGEGNEAQLYTCGMHPWIVTEEPGSCPICGMDLTPKRDAPAEADAAGGERQIAYWRAPMDPMEIYDEPGKSKMGMDLVPVYEDELIGGVEIRIDPVTEQNMGVRTAEVKKDTLIHTIRTYGHITYDETRTAQISPKVNGWFEELYVDFTGEMVEKGDPLYEIYSPELLAAQEEYLTALRNYQRIPNERSRELLASARRRLDFFDVAESEVETIKETGEVRKTVMIRSPFQGVVTHKNAVEGSYVKAGTTVYRIADLSRVWVEAHIFEYELGRVRKGQEAEMTLPYHPGQVYHGVVSYIYPYLQRQTRDVIIRLEFENPDLELKPDMYADVRIETVSDDPGMMIPSEAVIRSGERNVVFVDKGRGKFSPREVNLGMTLDGGSVQVLSGLAPGEEVVTSGQFLLDSESKLQEAVQKMMAVQPGPEETPAPEEDDFFSDMESDAEDAFFDDMTEKPEEDFFSDFE